MTFSIPGMSRRSNTLLLLLAVAANLHSANTHQSSTSQDAAVSSFSCVEKVIGGYYADVSLGCTMFHVCTLGEKGEIRDIIFKCVPGTLFSQEKRVCEREEEVNCAITEQFYHLNNDLYGPGIIPETAAESAASPGPFPKEVFDPTIALMSAPDPPASSADSSSPEDSTSISLAAPVLPPAVPPTSSPSPPPTAPPGVTASTSRMSTSTSASINFSYPASLPFTVSKTFSSTSVSASSRVRIKTPLSDIFIGTSDQPSLPAPHLRPSLLRLVARNQANLRDHTPPDTVTSQTPVDFQDIPRLTTESSLSLSHALHIRSRRQTLSNVSNTRRQSVRSDLNHNSSRRQNFVSSRGIRRQQVQPQITQGPKISQIQTVDSNNRQVTFRKQQTRPPLTASSIIDSGQNNHNTEPQKTIVATIVQPSRSSLRQRIRRPQLRNPSHTQTQNRDITNNNRQTIQSLNLDANINSNSQSLVPKDNNKAKPFNLDQENKVSDQTQNKLAININQNIQEALTLTDSEINSSNSVSSSAQNKNAAQLQKNKSQIEQNSVPISSNNPRLRPNVRKTARVGLDRTPTSATDDNNNESVSNRQQSVFNIQQSVFNRQQSIFNPQQSVISRQQSAISDIYHDIPLTPDVSRPLTLTNQFPPDRTIVDTGSEHSPSTGTENTNSIVSTQQPPILFAPTSFTCADKIHGGLYADVETGCSVFHICSVEPDGSYRSNRFVCGSGTLFDQTSRTCQVAAAVDCARSPALYYLNEPFQTPVLLEFEAEFPEQQFDFPRVPPSSSSSSSPSSNSFTHSRVRRDKDGEADLCHTRPVGTPLADITTSCQEYTVCEVSNGQIVERRYPCKKGHAFSQLHRKCLSAKKVKCAMETLSEILGLGAMRDTAGYVLNKRKRGPGSLLHSYRFRRAALPPLTNLVLTPGVQDARVRRALFNLAALQQWAQDNAHHTSFIEVYTLHSRGKNNYYPKKGNLERSYVPHSENNNYHTYAYVQRRKRQALLDDAHLIGNSDIVSQSQSVTSTGISPAKVHKGLETITVGRHSSSSSVVDAPVTTTAATTTTTTLTVPTSTSAKLEEPTAPTIIDPATKIISTKVTPPPLTTITVNNTGDIQVTKIPTTTNAPTVTLLSSNVSASSLAPNSVTTLPSITSTIITSSSVTPALKMPSTTSEPTTTVPAVTELPETPLNNETQPLNETPTDPINSTSSDVTNKTMMEIPVLGTNNTTAVTENSTNSTIKETDAPTTTTVASLEAVVGTSTTTISHESKISGESTKSSEATPTPVSTETTTIVSQQSTAGTTETVTTSTQGVSAAGPSSSTIPTTTTTTTPPTTPTTPTTTINLPETSFTCKDKTLEKFYPDTEVNCQVFHYCSPGFTQEQVLDIKFLCTNGTMFDVGTQKCESKELVVCLNETIPSPPTPSPPTPSPPTPSPPTTSPPTPSPPTPSPPTPSPPTPSPPTPSPPTPSPPTPSPPTPTPPTPSPPTPSPPTPPTPPAPTRPTTPTPTQTIISPQPTTSTISSTATPTITTSITPPITPTIESTTQTTTPSAPLTSEAPTNPTTASTIRTPQPVNVTPVTPSNKSEITIPVTEIPTTNNNTESNKEVTTVSSPDSTDLNNFKSDTKTSRENVDIEESVSSTTIEPTDDDIVTELGPLYREVPLQLTESPSAKDSTNAETEALTPVSSSESIAKFASSETSNSPSVSIIPTQPTQSAH